MRDPSFSYASARRMPKPRRRAFVYVFILMTVLFVTVVGLSGLTLARIQWREDQDSGNLAGARLCAQSAIEVGFLMITSDSNWRTSRGAGTWGSGTLGDGTWTLTAAFVDDGDGDTSNDDVVLTGTGVQGEAVHKTQVTLAKKNGAMQVVPESWKQIVGP